MTSITERVAAALADRYRIARELGAGGMATVYLAEDLKHDRKVAIKVLKPELAAVLGAERFVQEIKTTAALSHPHILPLFDSGTADGFLFYVMPYIKGETIRERLNRETQFGVDEAVRIAREVADALDYAHRNGVIHRDIKPENILLHDGRPMVMDFGIALAVSAAAGGRMTETGLSLGTPHYMSPEQATADKEITGRSDVYSLASVLYEMLAGVPPHEGGSAQQTIMRIVTETPRPVAELRKSAPANVAAAVAKALEKLPADRFDSAKAFADALGDARFTVATTAYSAPSSRAAVRWVPWGITAALAVWLGVALLGRRTQSAAESRAMTFQVESAGDSVVPIEVAISPDGRDIVFSGRSRGVVMLYHRELGVAGVRPVEGTEGAGADLGSVLTVLPDRSVTYWIDQELHEIRLDGGRPRRFAKVGSFPAGMSWSEQSGLVLGMLTFSRPTGLSRVSRGDTAVTAVTEVPAGGMHHDPVILPGGEHAAFTAIGGGNAIGVASLRDGTWERYEINDPPQRVLGYAQGLLIYRSASGLMAIAWDERRRRPVGDPVPIPGVPAGARSAAVSADGTLAIVATGFPTYEIVLVDPSAQTTVLIPAVDDAFTFNARFGPGGTRVAYRTGFIGINSVRILDVRTRLQQPLRVKGAGQRAGIAWTRDGRVFVAEAEAGRPGDDSPARRWTRLSAQPADGSDSARAAIEFTEARVLGFDVSADGRLAALVTAPWSAPSGTTDITLVRMDSTQPPRALAATAANESAPRFSPNGRWIAYASDESGNHEVYVRSTSGSAVVQVSERSGGQPVWSSDGARLYYRSGRAIVATDLVETANGGLGVRAHHRVVEGDFFGSESDRVAFFDVDPRGRIVLARAVPGDAVPITVRAGWIAEVKAAMAAKRP